jgi:hypothetical protein
MQDFIQVLFFWGGGVKIGSPYVTQADLELTILLPQLSEC